MIQPRLSPIKTIYPYFGTLSILPPELRIIIYSYAIASGSPNIVATSRAIKKEAPPVSKEGVCRLEFNVLKTLTIYPSQDIADKIQHLHIRLNLKDPSHESSALSYVWMNPWLRLISSREHRCLSHTILTPTKRLELRRKTCTIIFDCTTAIAKHLTWNNFDVIKTLLGFQEVVIQIVDNAPTQTVQQLRDRKESMQPDPGFSFEPLEKRLPGAEVLYAYGQTKKIVEPWLGPAVFKWWKGWKEGTSLTFRPGDHKRELARLEAEKAAEMLKPPPVAGEPIG